MCVRILLTLAAWLACLDVMAEGSTVTGCPQPTQSQADSWRGESQWQAIERAGLRFGAIRIHVDNVYGLAGPSENVWYARAADFLHIRTRQGVVRQLLLLHEGDAVSAQQVYQAIRHLREQTFLRAADITPIRCAEGSVDLLVDVSDAWTLKADLRFARAGNANQWRVKFEDSNFLGSGDTLAFGHQKTLERSADVLEFLSPNLFGTDWTLAAYIQNFSDGHGNSLEVAKPFLLDTTPWAAAIVLLDQSLHLNFYERGVRTWYLPQREKQFQASWQELLHWSGETAFRAGVAVEYVDYRYDAPVPLNPGALPSPLPEPRTLAGIGPIVSLHQDRYASFTNLRDVARVEDYNLGWDASASMLYEATVLGASANGPEVKLTASKGFEPLSQWLVLADSTVSARRVKNEWRSENLYAEATAYGQPWPYQTLVLHVDYAALLHADPEDQLYIGGFQALRGYPNFYATGSRRLRLTLEDRIVTPWVWFHTFQVGFVAFGDAAIVDRAARQGWSPWYSSVGAGLRFGNLRGSFNRVLYFTVAKPLHTDISVHHGLQWVVGNVLTF